MSRLFILDRLYNRWDVTNLVCSQAAPGDHMVILMCGVYTDGRIRQLYQIVYNVIKW